jgi:hypothetical protein
MKEEITNSYTVGVVVAPTTLGSSAPRNQKRQPQHSVEVPFTRPIMDDTDIPCRRRNGDTPIGYPGQAALWGSYVTRQLKEGIVEP